MNLYTDTELDNDIKQVKKALAKCSNTCRKTAEGIYNFNKIILNRAEFILSQFKIFFNGSLMRV